MGKTTNSLSLKKNLKAERRWAIATTAALATILASRPYLPEEPSFLHPACLSNIIGFVVFGWFVGERTGRIGYAAFNMLRFVRAFRTATSLRNQGEVDLAKDVLYHPGTLAAKDMAEHDLLQYRLGGHLHPALVMGLYLAQLVGALYLQTVFIFVLVAAACLLDFHLRAKSDHITIMEVPKHEH